MAFRKRFPRRRFNRRFRAPLARKRKTWVTSLRSGCNYLSIEYNPPVESCSMQFKAVLLDNALLEGGFSDRATVKRILGDFWFTPQPDFGNYTTPELMYSDLANFGNHFVHVGLLKKGLGRDSTGTLQTPNFFPINDDFDYSEAQWLKTWQHLWQPQDQTSFILQNVANGAAGRFPVGTDDTHTYLVPGTAACNELATGSGFICIETEHSVDCEECPQPFGLATESIEVAIPQKWHVHLDIKKSIPMREDDELYLHFDWAGGIGSGGTPIVPWHTSMYFDIKTLVEF